MKSIQLFFNLNIRLKNIQSISAISHKYLRWDSDIDKTER